MKMKTRTTVSFIAVMIVFSSIATAQTFKSNVSKKGTTAASFLSIGQGARALSMGGAFVAIADDPSSLYWNPAGIADIPGGAIYVDHTQWLADIRYNFLASTISLGDMGTLGLSFTASSIDEMRVTTTDNPEGNGETFSVSDIAFSVGYAIKLTDKFSIGFNPKFVYQKIWKMSASAIAIDIGVKYITPFDGAVLGMSISNFGTKMQMQGTSSAVTHDIDPSTTGNNGKIPANLATEEWTLPLNFRVGVAYSLFKTESNSLIVSVNASHPNDNYESIDLGGEYVFNDFLFLRGGYKSMFLADSEEGMTLGIGVEQALVGNVQISFDYAYQDFGILKSAQKFAIGILF
jgi:opacity protein-like surface antigen